MTRLRIRFASVACLGLGILAGLAEAQEKRPPKVTFEDDVMPILKQKCASCHNPDKKSGDLDVTNYTNLMLGGGSGEVVEAGDSGASYLYELVTHQSEPYMPPESPKLPDEMIETIRKWIDGGVLETKSSKARIKKKKSFNMTLADTPTERPAVPPVPPKLSLEPITRTPGTTAVTALATSPWAPLAAVASQHQVLLYNTQSLELVGSLPFPEGVAEVLKFSRNGSLLLAGGGQGGANGKAIVWNIHTGERVIEIGDELDTVLAADISSDQTLIALGGPQRIVRIYSTETGRLLHELRKHTDWVCSIEFSPDSVLLATGDRAGGLYVWEGWTGREYLTLKAHSQCVTGVSWRSDSNVVASCSEDGTVRLWEMENGGQIKNWGHGGGVASVEFTRDGRLVTAGRNRVVSLWDQNGGKQRDFEAFGDLALSVTYCDETNRTIAGDWTGEIRVWNAADGARVGALSPNPPKLAERLDAASKLLAAKTAEHKPLDAAYKAAKTAADKAKTDLANAEKTATEYKKQTDDANAKLNAAKAAAEKATNENTAAAKAVTDLEPGVPMLTAAAEKAATAAGMLEKDKELKDMATQLKTLADKRVAMLAANKKIAAEKKTALDKAKAALVTAEKVAKEKAAGYAAAVKEVEKFKPLVKPAVDKLAVAQKAAEAAAAAVASAKAQVDRWNTEIAFAARLTQLNTRRADLLKQLAAKEDAYGEQLAVLDTAQAAFNKSKGELTTAQGNAVASKKTADEAVAKVKITKEAMVKADAAMKASAANVTMYQNVVTPLGVALAKSQEAAKAGNNAKDLADAAKLLQTLVDGKKKQLADATKDLEVKTKAVAASKQEVAKAEKASTDAAAKYLAAQKRVTDLTAALKPVEEKAIREKQVADQASAAVDAAQGEVDKVNNEINEAKGVKTA